MNELRILTRRPSLIVGVAGPVLLGAWTGVPPTPDDVVACLAPLIREASKSGRYGLVVAVHPAASLPDEHVRAAIAQEMRKLDPHLACGATVIARGGFSGAAARAVASTLQLLVRTGHPEKIVSTGLEAARFVAGELAGDQAGRISVEEIAAAYDELTRDAWRDAR